MPEAATPPEKLVLCLQTGQHFNNGHKFYQFEPILAKACQQEAFGRTQMSEMAQAFVRRGKNCNVLVYGPTNSGKTYTMTGPQDNRNKTPRDSQ